MRRILCALAAGALLLCCGCQKTSDGEAARYTIPTAFTAQLHAEQGTLSFDADFSIDENGTAVTTLQSPEALKTLEITETADACSFRFLGLKLETPPALLPDASFAKLLYAALETVRDSARCAVSVQGQTVSYNGMTPVGDVFTLTLNKADGALQDFTVSKYALNVTFSDFQATV